jgi:hypothetical protein
MLLLFAEAGDRSFYIVMHCCATASKHLPLLLHDSDRACIAMTLCVETEVFYVVLTAAIQQGFVVAR